MVGFNSAMEQMKERFAKLLLGEDMSGGGKGVSSALALSNAFTSLAGMLTSRCLSPSTKTWHSSFFFLLQISNHDVKTLCCSFHFQERLTAEMFEIIHLQFLSWILRTAFFFFPLYNKEKAD